MADDITQELGRALRRIREGRGLRLSDVRAMSGDRFSPTTVAGYERGEREISLRRFVELCGVYGVRPGQLLARVLTAVERGDVRVDLTKVQHLDPEGERIVGTFLRNVAARRGIAGTEVMTIRAADLEVLATAADRSADDLLAEIGATRERR